MFQSYDDHASWPVSTKVSMSMLTGTRRNGTLTFSASRPYSNAKSRQCCSTSGVVSIKVPSRSKANPLTRKTCCIINEQRKESVTWNRSGKLVLMRTLVAQLETPQSLTTNCKIACFSNYIYSFDIILMYMVQTMKLCCHSKEQQ